MTKPAPTKPSPRPSRRTTPKQAAAATSAPISGHRRGAKVAAAVLAVVMFGTLAGGAVLGTTNGSDADPAPAGAPTTEPYVDLSQLSDEQLATLLAQTGVSPEDLGLDPSAVPTTTTP